MVCEKNRGDYNISKMPTKFSDSMIERWEKEIIEYEEIHWIKRIINYMLDWRYRVLTNLSVWLEEQLTNQKLLNVVKLHNWKNLKDDDKVIEILRYVRSRTKYESDTRFGTIEKWLKAIETYETQEGDCIANYEEIYTKNGIKKVGDLKVGDYILSYDMKRKFFCIKPITKIWEKGKLPIKRVHLRNGQHIDITDNHPLWARTNQKDSDYKKTYLKDIDLTRWWKRKLPIAKKIPYKIRDIKWFTEDLCFVLGHFLAEGWIETYHVQSSGYDLIEQIIPMLEKNKIPFSEYKNNSGVPCINFLKSGFKEYLRKVKTNSFDIHLTEEIFHLPENKLKKILDGFFLGDGHNGNYPDKRGYDSNKQEVYSTSSEQWARDIQRIGLQIGKTFHIWKQENHRGVGNKPIYRITYNPQSHFLKDFGYKNISEVSISYIEDLGKTEMRDFEVADTHTFIFKNGLISHQCEDGAILILILSRMSGISPERIRLVVGKVEGGYHAWIRYLPKQYPLDPVYLDWCYFYDSKKIPNRKFYDDNISPIYEGKKPSKYISIDWGVNDKRGYGKYQKL